MLGVKVEKHTKTPVISRTGGDRDMAIIIIISYQSYCVYIKSMLVSHIGMDKDVFYVFVSLKSHYWFDGE